MNQKTKVLFVAEDPGGFNSLWPVIQKINKSSLPYKTIVLLAGVSRSIAKERNIDFTDGDIETDDLYRFLDNQSPDIIVYGTSHGLSIDKKVLLWSKEKKIKTISILDYWSNYRMRFSTPTTDDLVYMPDKICVIDEFMFTSMIRSGFKKDILHITGNPFFDTFKDLDFKSTNDYIVFASQPFSETYDDDDEESKLNEISIFSDCVSALEECGVNLPLYVAFHPREKNREKFSDIIKRSKLDISITKEKTIDIAKNARLVIGIRTMILFEVAMIGKNVISYQPGIKPEEDVLVSNILGLSNPAYSYQELVEKIKKALIHYEVSENLESARKKYIYNNATKNVIDVIELLAK